MNAAEGAAAPRLSRSRRMAMVAGMTDSEADEPRPSHYFLGAGKAVLIGMTFLLGAGAIAVFTWRDHGREEKLESFEQVTAVGDSHFFDGHLPAGANVSIEHAGRTWHPGGLAKQAFRDTEMRAAGADAATGLKLYQPIGKARADELFLKIEPNGYVPLRPDR